MNRTAIQPRLVVPPVRDLVDSITQNASAALRKFERMNATLGSQESPPQDEGLPGPDVVASIEPNPSSLHMNAYVSIAETSTSPFNKGAAFVAVALLHIVVLLVISTITPETKPAVPEPLHVISVTASQVEQVTLPIPVPVLHLPELSPAIEPEINVAVVESSAISVTPPASSVESEDSASNTPKLVSSVEYIREPVAKYPPAARALRQQGTVTLRALVDVSGHAREVNVHRSSGSRILDDAGLNAVSQALFKPYSENGRAIPVYVLIPIEFGAAG